MFDVVLKIYLKFHGYFSVEDFQNHYDSLKLKSIFLKLVWTHIILDKHPGFESVIHYSDPVTYPSKKTTIFS